MDAAENDENWSTAGEVEHKLAYTEIYTLFLDHFEAKISGEFSCLIRATTHHGRWR